MPDGRYKNKAIGLQAALRVSRQEVSDIVESPLICLRPRRDTTQGF